MNSFCLVRDKWTENDYKKFLNFLINLSDKKLINFNERIISTKKIILGIKTPILRDIAKEIFKGNFVSFLNCLSDNYFEENLVRGFVIGYIKDKGLFLKYFLEFLNKVDNWATCDMCVSSFKIMKKENFYDFAKELSLKNDEFVSRVGLIIILDYYVDDEHIFDILSLVKMIRSNYYYVNMAVSWLISVLFVKYRTNTLELLKQRVLPVFVQNKAISKIRDSYRVTKEDKELVKRYLLN